MSFSGRCDLCNEKDLLTNEKINGRIKSVCDWCLGSYEDYLDGKREEEKLRRDDGQI